MDLCCEGKYIDSIISRKQYVVSDFYRLVTPNFFISECDKLVD